MEEREITCIACPMGCILNAKIEGESISITGNLCKIGITYGTKELQDPRRVLTTSIPVEVGGEMKMLSVKTKGDIPKNRLLDCLREIKAAKPTKAVNCGDVIVPDILGLGVDVVATRDVFC